jgi:hypothetical protein
MCVPSGNNVGVVLSLSTMNKGSRPCQRIEKRANWNRPRPGGATSEQDTVVDQGNNSRSIRESNDIQQSHDDIVL